jgi:hypothetical protein
LEAELEAVEGHIEEKEQELTQLIPSGKFKRSERLRRNVTLNTLDPNYRTCTRSRVYSTDSEPKAERNTFPRTS